jgi:hypothetical protein
MNLKPRLDKKTNSFPLWLLVRQGKRCLCASPQVEDVLASLAGPRVWYEFVPRQNPRLDSILPSLEGLGATSSMAELGLFEIVHVDGMIL